MNEIQNNPSIENLDYTAKLFIFEARFKQHEWWKKTIEGTPLANDLAVMAVEVFNSLVTNTNAAERCEHGILLSQECAICNSDTIMTLQADVTALSYHLNRALDVLKNETPLDVSQIKEAERALENSTILSVGKEIK